MSGRPRLVVAVPAEMVAGFELAGADTRVVAGSEEADALLGTLFGEGERGVIGVYEPFLAGLDPGRRARLEASVAPVVVPIPTGLAAEAAAGRRARLIARLQRAVGYHITFEEEGS